MQRSNAVLALALSLACGPPPAPPAPQPVTSASRAEVAPLPSPPEPQPALVETDVFMPLAAYRAAFETHLGRRFGDQPALVLEQREAGGIAHDIVSFDGPRGSALVSVGLARRAQPHAQGETPARVELMTLCPERSRKVAEVLVQLGRLLHADERPLDIRFKAFEPLRTDAPIFELEHFILVPATAGTVGEEEVVVLQVVPAAEDEYAYVKMRGDGAARAWWHERRGDATLPERWTAVMSREP